MRFVGGTRRQLHEWFAGLADIRVGRSERTADLSRLRASNSELLFLFDDDEPALPLPPVIVVHDGAEREVLAWAATYIPFRPLTAFCRVVSRRDLPVFGPRLTNKAATGLAMAFVGAIFAEAGIAPHAHDRRYIPSMPLVMGTYSFLAARALLMPFLHVADAVLRDRWFILQRVLGARRLVSSAVLQFWTRVSEFAGDDDPLRLFQKEPVDIIGRAMHELVQTRAISGDVWRRLTDSDTIDMSGRPLEERVRAFQLFSAVSRERSIGADALALALAYLANQILPGTFEHSGVLREEARNSDAALLWYGFIAGLTEGSRVGSLYDGFGWRLCREILRDESPLDRTNADVALDELAILHENPSTRASIRASSPPYLRVEVLPCVYAVANWGQPQAASTIASVQDPVSELGLGLARATDAYREILRQARTIEPRTNDELKPRNSGRKKLRDP